ncbi:conserved Plasmodium protein, unknown function [Plasmodium gonderi]|uniref:Uncharacterized protein n=1 Tax=Plasmodium gonderi TaxID=77519 RepID=A0A1Y1JIN4_PLAGO|nr:conserved Plasmodium protein, unknown function [Plasmodium gonderi]GAW82369.1 conserved Plasmodium protein, unknown function [Plasmodium gonderi]
MRAQSETIKPSTPLRRIPKNRGTVVRNATELNPLSEQELKNVIHVYSEANKTYYQNCAKNERNPKKKKKKATPKKIESEEFDMNSLNPLKYRNEKYEENGTLLHLPGTSITPKYMNQNPNADYGVSSLSYGTLHKSNPLSWGCEYKKHYELPTICSIVKSKHPIYSKPQNAEIEREHSNIYHKMKSKKKNNNVFRTSSKNDNKLKDKRVPTFGNYQEDEITSIQHSKHITNEHRYENNDIVDTTIKDSSHSDKSKDISDNTFNYDDFYNDSENSSINNSKSEGLKNVLQEDKHKANLNSKRYGNNIEEKKNLSNIHCNNENKNLNKELKLVNPKRENDIVNMQDNNSLDIILSNVTLMELKNSDTESECLYSSSVYFNGDTSDCMNNSQICGKNEEKHVKSDCNNSHDYSTPQMALVQDSRNKGMKKQKNRLPTNKTTKAYKSFGKQTIVKGSLENKESYYDSFGKVSDKNTKGRKVLIKCRMQPIEEHNPMYYAYEINTNKNNKKSKQKRQFKKKNSLKCDQDYEQNLLNENSFNKSKKKGHTKGLRYDKISKKNNLESNSIKNNKSLNMRTINTLGSQNGTFIGNNNFVVPESNNQQSSKIEQVNFHNMKNIPNEQSYAKNEIIDIMNQNTPKGGWKINLGKEAYTDGIPSYAYAVHADAIPRVLPVTYSMYENVPYRDMKNQAPNVLSEVLPDLAVVNLCKPECNTKRYHSTSVLPKIQPHLAQDSNTSSMQNHIDRAQTQMFHVPINMSQGKMQTQVSTVQRKMPNMKMQVSNTQMQIPNTQMQIPNTQMQIPNTQMQIPNTQMQIPNTQMQIPNTQMQVPNTQMQVPITPMQIPITPIQWPITQMQMPIAPIQMPITPMQMSIAHIGAPYGKAGFTLKQDSLPQTYMPHGLEQNHIVQKLQAPVMENPTVLEQIQPTNTVSNRELRIDDKDCNLVELSNQLVQFKGHNNVEYNNDAAFSRSIDHNYNTSYNITECNSGDLNKKEYVENIFTNPLIKGGVNIGGMYANNINPNKCIDQYKSVDDKVIFSKMENAVPSWVKTYTDMQTPVIKSEASNVSCLNINTNTKDDNANSNVNSSMKNFSCLSNVESCNNNVYHQINNPQLVGNTKRINPIDISNLIKTSNENLINLQNKQLLDILHEKGKCKPSISINNIDNNHPLYDELNIHTQNNVSEQKCQNFIDNTIKYFSCAYPTDVSKKWVGETESIIFSTTPEEIINKNQLIQNNSQLTSHLN